MVKANHALSNSAQNVRITEALTVIKERLRTLVAFLVTEESDLVGSVSKGPQAQEC